MNDNGIEHYHEWEKSAAYKCLKTRKDALTKIITAYENSSLCNSNLYNVPEIQKYLGPESLSICDRDMQAMLEAFLDELLLLRYDFQVAIDNAQNSITNLNNIINSMKVYGQE